MGVISELDRRLNAVNTEIVNMEFDAIFLDDNKEFKRLLEEVKTWRSRELRFFAEYYDGLVPQFNNCYDALDSLLRYVRSDMQGRFNALYKLYRNPADSSDDEDQLSPDSDVDPIDESHVSKRVYENSITECKALIGEIMQDFQDSERTTLVEFLQNSDYHRFFPMEWMCMYELRLRTIQTAIQVSKLMVHFISYLPSNEEIFGLLKSKIESIRNISTPRCVVAERFVTLIQMAGDTMSQMKLKEQMFSTSSAEEEELYINMITHFYNAVMDLEWIMSFKNVSLRRSLVNGARMRLQGVLGHVLFSMQGVRMKIRKQHDGYCAKMKSIIPDLWRDMEAIPEKPQVQVQGVVGEAGTSGTKPDDEIEESGTKLSRSVGVRKTREANYAGPSGTKEVKVAGHSLGKKDDEEAGDPSGNKKDDKGDEEEEESGLRLRSTRRRTVSFRITGEDEAGDSSGMKDDEEAGDPSGNKKDDQEAAGSSGKQVEEAGYASTEKKDDNEVAANSSGKEEDDEASKSTEQRGDDQEAGTWEMECEEANPSDADEERFVRFKF